MNHCPFSFNMYFVDGSFMTGIKLNNKHIGCKKYFIPQNYDRNVKETSSKVDGLKGQKRKINKK